MSVPNDTTLGKLKELPELKFLLGLDFVEGDPTNAQIEGARERHQIYSLLLLAILAHYWRGEPQPGEDERLGHNIAALAVNRYGIVVDFDFNHNYAFNSSVEHAEARLMRRLFHLNATIDVARLSFDVRQNQAIGQYRAGSRVQPALPGAADDDLVDAIINDSLRRSEYGSVLDDLTVYTSLEPCDQCSGTMSMARVARTIYLQVDPGLGANKISHILFNLKTELGADKDKFRNATIPVSADHFALDYDGTKIDYYARLNADYGGKGSVTGYLRRKALPIFAEMAMIFFRMLGGLVKDTPGAIALKHPDFKPEPTWAKAENADPNDERSRILTNEECLVHAGQFYRFATRHGRRGTPHGA